MVLRPPWDDSLHRERRVHVEKTQNTELSTEATDPGICSTSAQFVERVNACDAIVPFVRTKLPV
jgi:hypothetical protein